MVIMMRVPASVVVCTAWSWGHRDNVGVMIKDMPYHIRCRREGEVRNSVTPQLSFIVYHGVSMHHFVIDSDFVGRDNPYRMATMCKLPDAR